MASLRLIYASPLWAVTVLVAGMAVQEADRVRFLSPRGKYEVTLEQLGHVKFPEAEPGEETSQVSHVRYLFSFFAAGVFEPRAQVEFADVYGWTPDARPAESAALFKAIVWSPEEHFAVLDEEGWASAPGAPERLAVALDPTLGWKTEPFRLSEPVWTDELHAVGNVLDDCSYAVAMFDGRAGRTQRLFTPASPLGYEIMRVEGRRLQVRTLLDNCRSEDDVLAFLPDCFVMDLDSMQHERAECEVD